MADLSGVWRYDTSQVIAAPASGYLRTGPAPVTQTAISATTKGGANVHTDLMALTTGATLLVQEVADATLAIKFQLTAAPIDHTSWVELAVTEVATTATGDPRPNEDLLVTGTAAAQHAPYATVAELQYHLNITAPTPLQTQGMQRCLDAAAEEIDWELGYTADTPAPTPLPQLVVTVNIDRAVEHWRQSFSPFGVVAVGAESEPIVSARDTWYRHARKLASLRTLHGVA
jgi:hypothetical protein